MRDLHELHLEQGDTVVASPTGAQLALVEQMVGAKLPADYIAFLCFSNGGYLGLSTVWYGAGARRRGWSINNFFRISTEDKETEDTEEVAWRHRNKLPGIPRRMVPFARNGGDDALYLDLSSQGQGRIVLYTHDPPSGPTLVTGSFASLIDALEPDAFYVPDPQED